MDTQQVAVAAWATLPRELLAPTRLFRNFTAHFKVTVTVTVALTSLSCALRFFGNQRKCWQHLEGKFVINTVYQMREARNSEISKLRWEINSSLCHNICSAACAAGTLNGRHVVPPQDIIRHFCYLWHTRKTLIKCCGRLHRTIFYLGKYKSEGFEVLKDVIM